MSGQESRLDQELRDLLLPLGVVSMPVAEGKAQPFTVLCLYDKRDRQLWDLEEVPLVFEKAMLAYTKARVGGVKAPIGTCRSALAGVYIKK